MGEASDSDHKPETQSSGSRQPPRPPPPVALSAPADDPDEDPKNSRRGRKKNRKKETVRISLSPKPTAKTTVHLALPPKPAAGSDLLMPASPVPGAGAATIEEAIKFIHTRRLKDRWGTSARSQLHTKAGELESWARFSFVMALLALVTMYESYRMGYLIVGSLLLVTSILSYWEVHRIQKVIRCLNRHRVRTLDDLNRFRAPNA